MPSEADQVPSRFEDNEKAEFHDDGEAHLRNDTTPDPLHDHTHADDVAAGGDAALANANMYFKIFALVTALLLPGNST